jgi:signal peptidase
VVYLKMQVSRDTTKLISIAIQKHGKIDLAAHGNSMFPFIREGDICRFVSCERALLKKGDIVLFRTLSGSLVAHRLQQIKLINNNFYYYFKGDTNLSLDEPISQEQLIGKLTWTRKGTTVYRAEGLVASVWGRAILAFPMLSLLMRMYLNRKENT